MDQQTFLVEDDLANERIDKIIAAVIPSVTRSYAQRLVAAAMLPSTASSLPKTA